MAILLVFGVMAATYESFKAPLINLATMPFLIIGVILIHKIMGEALSFMSAMRVFKSFRSVIICSAVISVFCAALGIILSILFSTPVGSTIVAADIVVFFVFSLIGRIKS